MKPVRLGIIGCGIAARNLHWPALKKKKDRFRITMVCNHTEPKAKAFADMVGGVPYVLDYRELLESDDVEAVSIALPFHLNLPVTRNALHAGKHVIVEKPLASSMEEAREMVSLAQEFPGIVTMLAENFRCRPMYLRVKELLESGVIGKVYSALWNYFFFVDPAVNKYAQTLWRMGERYSGGFIVDAGVHNIALLRILFGDFVSGRGLVRSVTPEIGRYDTFIFQFTMDSGVNGVLNLYYSVRGLRANTLYVFGDTGTMIIERERFTIKKEGESDREDTAHDDMGYTGEFEDFYDAIRSGADVTSTFSEGYRDLEVITAGLESAMMGETVRFSS